MLIESGSNPVQIISLSLRVGKDDTRTGTVLYCDEKGGSARPSAEYE